MARDRGIPAFDTDDYYWLPTDPPFQRKRPIPERLRLLRESLESAPSWALSGSLCSWGDSLVPMFDVVVFLTLDHDVRMERLKRREIGRYGAARIAPGGDLHGTHVEFMDWASRYDSAGSEQRSRVSHEEWLATLPASCTLVRLDSSVRMQELVATVEKWTLGMP